MPDDDRRAPRWTLAVGFAVIVSAAALFAALAVSIADGSTLALADQALTDSIGRTVPPSLISAFAIVTVLANTPVLWLLAIAGSAVLLWRRDFALACFWIAAIAGNGILTRVLKAVFERARPAHAHDILTAHGFSFPSGHSSGAVAAYGALAYLLIRSTPARWHLPITLSAASIALIVGSSRVFLQVHFASDVLAGFATGAAWLALCIMIAELSRRDARGSMKL